MFPGPHASIIRNEMGEPLGWDYPCDEPDFDPYVGGEFTTPGNSYTGSQTVTATPERPVYRPCPCARRAVKPEVATVGTERFEREQN